MWGCKTLFFHTVSNLPVAHWTARSVSLRPAAGNRELSKLTGKRHQLCGATFKLRGSLRLREDLCGEIWLQTTTLMMVLNLLCVFYLSVFLGKAVWPPHQPQKPTFSAPPPVSLCFLFFIERWHEGAYLTAPRLIWCWRPAWKARADCQLGRTSRWRLWVDTLQTRRNRTRASHERRKESLEMQNAGDGAPRAVPFSRDWPCHGRLRGGQWVKGSSGREAGSWQKSLQPHSCVGPYCGICRQTHRQLAPPHRIALRLPYWSCSCDNLIILLRLFYSQAWSMCKVVQKKSNLTLIFDKEKLEKVVQLWSTTLKYCWELRRTKIWLCFYSVDDSELWMVRLRLKILTEVFI